MADRIQKEKKRKREKDGSSKPSKRIAIEADKQIEISLLESDKWAPVIGMSPSFQRNILIPNL
jgi:DNA-directed RNA polymerase I subunit RPA49